MELRIFVEPQFGATYAQQLAMAQTAEAQGFGAFFRSDHYLTMGGDGLPGPTDTWLTLGAIARETSTIRLGTLMCSATFRLPGPLAVQVAQADEMSRGRVELGIGAGWFADEHTAYGIPFPTTKQRFQMLEEQLQIITGLWRTPAGSDFTYEGEHYSLVGSPALPKPIQPGGPPVLIGGFGPKTTPRLAAQHAAEFNVPFAKVADFTDQRQRVRDACLAVDRDPDDMIFSVALTVICGENDEEVQRRAGHVGQDTGHLEEHGLVGSPSDVLDRLATYAEAGAERVYLQVLDLDDLDHVNLLGERVRTLLP